jgi:SPX domain protein involved in polyphosphate accumulation
MQFGKTLKQSIYTPWKEQYLDYPKLKGILREDGSQDEDKPWTADDDARFSDELFATQLDKVAAFQESTFRELEQRTNATGEKLRKLAPEEGKSKSDTSTANFKEIETELDKITNETKELKKYSNINVTAARKIIKKHDRKRGSRYSMKPMLQNVLAKRPFNSEQAYTPMLNKLSLMYFAVRQSLEEGGDPKVANSVDATSSAQQDGEKYTAYKCMFLTQHQLIKIVDD